LSYRNS